MEPAEEHAPVPETRIETVRELVRYQNDAQFRAESDAALKLPRVALCLEWEKLRNRGFHTNWRRYYALTNAAIMYARMRIPPSGKPSENALRDVLRLAVGMAPPEFVDSLSIYSEDDAEISDYYTAILEELLRCGDMFSMKSLEPDVHALAKVFIDQHRLTPHADRRAQRTLLCESFFPADNMPYMVMAVLRAADGRKYNVLYKLTAILRYHIDNPEAALLRAMDRSLWGPKNLAHGALGNYDEWHVMSDELSEVIESLHVPASRMTVAEVNGFSITQGYTFSLHTTPFWYSRTCVAVYQKYKAGYPELRLHDLPCNAKNLTYDAKRDPFDVHALQATCDYIKTVFNETRLQAMRASEAAHPIQSVPSVYLPSDESKEDEEQDMIIEL
jgi:hypothetical protein